MAWLALAMVVENCLHPMRVCHERNVHTRIAQPADRLVAAEGRAVEPSAIC